jgi:hypothetical protein
VVMKETDQAKYDELSEEIWRVLEQREGIKEALTERE